MAKKRTRFLAAVLPMIAAAGLVTAAAPAQSATSASGPLGCSNHPWSNKDSDSGQVTSSSLVRPGPHASCGETARVYPGEVLYYHCYVTNESGNTWTHLRISGTNIQGWVYDGNLNDGGSTKVC
ncbi:hypothetical protein GCM10010387_60550 [Streptomyces inusitatus]|uniref:SH3b domain-containing protein n=1 Tax=Streptomyces inusitatus TaxID=68221 RepID=A0A918QLC4_9ACTN|nr:SH3 domain-containing protein [Streptomyces inusitatus]GGZ58549.1 hypothetical protein GCM10010387_60550 [Streptomyces inusitatus]